MDIAELAGQAAALVAGYLGAIAGGVADRFKDSAVERLYTTISDRLRRGPQDTAVLDSLATHPHDPARQHALAETLHQHATRDPAFAGQLGHLTYQAWIAPSAAGTGGTSGSHQINLSSTGALSVNRSTIANKIINKRSTKLGLAALVAVVLLGGTTIISYNIGQNTTEQPGSGEFTTREKVGQQPAERPVDPTATRPSRTEKAARSKTITRTYVSGDSTAEITVELGPYVDTIAPCQVRAPQGTAILGIQLDIYNKSPEGGDYVHLGGVIPVEGTEVLMDPSTVNDAEEGLCPVYDSADDLFNLGQELQPFQEGNYTMWLVGVPDAKRTSAGATLIFADDWSSKYESVRATF